LKVGIGGVSGVASKLAKPPIIIVAMPSRSSKAAQGRTPARAADPAFDPAGRPSKTQAKRESHDLQALGEAVAELPEAQLAALDLPETLRLAIHEWRRTRSHEGRRRQLQYIGKLMRGVDPAPLREAVAARRLGPAQDALRLHQAESWRSALIAGDEALTRWAAERPDCDVQHLRSLVRAARAEERPDAAPGAAVRQGRSYRELFQYVRAHLDPGI
jgi:ribosome-associated protein